MLFLGCSLSYNTTFGQELETEASAEVFLEEYSDAFQENFFEALKQKGIENYDKAINLLLVCKKIDDSKKVVDFELAKVYQQSKMYDAALEYVLNAVNTHPDNFWYVHTLVAILQAKNSSISEVEDQVPADNIAFKENLATVFYQMENYNAAVSIVNTMKNSRFTEDLNAKLKEGLKTREENTLSFSYSTEATSEDANSDSSTIDGYKNNIAHIIQSKNYLILDAVSKNALDNYPAQPYFYYARGLALNKKNKFREAAAVLEEALDYMLDDIRLANKIYQELSDAYSGLNNSVKANIYKQKIKPGF